MLSYVGLLPRLGLYPWPKNDSASRIITMMVAHAIYGTTTAACARQLLGQPAPSPEPIFHR